VDGFVPPSKTHLKLYFPPRNYHENAEDIVIAVVAIPVIDITLVVRVIVTNIGNVALNVS
jgi:uncharacterized membrane protein YGL010W